MSDNDPFPSGVPDLLCSIAQPGCRSGGSLLDVWIDGDYVALDGELCTHAVSEVEPLLYVATRTGGDVVVDLRWLRFIDGRGIRLLQFLHDDLARLGRRLCLHAPNAWVRRVLEIAGDTYGHPWHAVTTS